MKLLRIVRNKTVPVLSSLKLAVISLLFLCLLIILGTLEQSQNGLYLAQQKYFNTYLSWWGFIPIPGTVTVLWIIFINLIFALIFKLKINLKNSGLIISHLGLILLLVSGFLNFYFTKEGFVDLYEGEKKSQASFYNDWFLEIKNSRSKKSFKISFDKLKVGILHKNDFPDIRVAQKYKNSQLFDTPFAGIILKQMPLEKDFEKNVPGLELKINNTKVLLEGLSKNLEIIDDYSFSLKRSGFSLPFSIELVDVSRGLHPNSEIAKSYASAIKINGIRDFTIAMNKPFRQNSFTIFQASYGIDLDQREFTVLAIVDNPYYQLPYYATLLMTLGLIVHFILKTRRKI